MKTISFDFLGGVIHGSANLLREKGWNKNGYNPKEVKNKKGGISFSN